MENKENISEPEQKPETSDQTKEKQEQSAGSVLFKVILFIMLAIPAGFLALMILGALVVMNM